MPFTMTHLIIAKNICGIIPEQIKNLPQYYLGSIAPDAVHNRANYNSDFKKAAHLCVGEEKWGMATNNDEWLDNIILFLNKYKNNKNYDFVLGYFTHIVADIYNNLTEWKKFKLKYPEELAKGYGGLYHLEGNKIDIELALIHESGDFFKFNINNSVSIDLEDLVFAEEIEKQKENILNNWYKNKERQDINLNKIITLESTMDFIEKASEFIIKNL